jgi:hypothetical protein
MSWLANQIYTLPNPGVAAALSREPLLAGRMFLVRDLEGIRFEPTRRCFLSPDATEDERIIRHGLPAGGLLAISPHLYRSGYDESDPPSPEFAARFYDGDDRPWLGDSPAEKWATIGFDAEIELLFPTGREPAYFPIRLLKLLKSVSRATATPIVYYWSTMWGGRIEDEVGWVFDQTDHVYEYVDDQTTVDYTFGGRQTITNRTPLQLLMSRLGLHLPTHFFALHTAFDWERYWLGS